MSRRAPTVTPLGVIPGYGYLIAALGELGPATAESIAEHLASRETPYDGPHGERTFGTGWTQMGVARMLSWMQRAGYPVIRSPLGVARAYARAHGLPAPRMGYWRIEKAPNRVVAVAMIECLTLALEDQRERRPTLAGARS